MFLQKLLIHFQPQPLALQWPHATVLAHFVGLAHELIPKKIALRHVAFEVTAVVDRAEEVDGGSHVQARHGAVRVDWQLRSEERRVGKECRSRWSPYH